MTERAQRTHDAHDVIAFGAAPLGAMVIQESHALFRLAERQSTDGAIHLPTTHVAQLVTRGVRIEALELAPHARQAAAEQRFERVILGAVRVQLDEYVTF